MRLSVPRRRCAFERGCCCRCCGRELLLEELVGIDSVFAGGRTEARRPGTGKKNLEVLPIATDGVGGERRQRRWWWWWLRW